MSNQPQTISNAEWEEIVQLPYIQDAWGLHDAEDPATELEENTYAAKFNYVSGSPGYIGELFSIQGDALPEPPVLLARDPQTHRLYVV